MNRRSFVRKSSLLAAGSLALPQISKSHNPPFSAMPVIVSTWDFGKAPHEAAWNAISKKGSALDACIAGVKVVEADETNHSVGIGGYPDRDGHVTLDACVMNEQGNCGGVFFVEEILHPSELARMVMEKTPHVYLAGQGAVQFALEQGFKKQNLLTTEAKEEWEKWCKQTNYKPRPMDEKNHDTVGMIAIDKLGNLSGCCSTSGWAYKMHGRVGDSPNIGSGLFVDNEIGAATSTGLGEYIIKICGAHLIVESMRNGRTPQEACEAACLRISSKYKNYKDFQACFIALGKDGTVGAYSLNKGFQYTVTTNGETLVYDAEYLE
ncbi:MAG: N(4)-(beta-N-acetylglucosaminyl)-L-asparaginase [Bacteroidia bacterium]|nr:N(4)-(beta-N-acetylglucosaminyl)-L-asparaginase [Bacteroidia bacterium]HQV00718.1 N(4)-(beta-N-acetylglucosaminyl)-L-asparaginase [Bacteroidia bacterium]